jgi:hypothetical protein
MFLSFTSYYFNPSGNIKNLKRSHCHDWLSQLSNLVVAAILSATEQFLAGLTSCEPSSWIHLATISEDTAFPHAKYMTDCLQLSYDACAVPKLMSCPHQ